MLRRTLLGMGLLGLVVHALAASGSAGVIVDQRTNVTNDGFVISQLFPDRPKASTKVFDNFNADQDYRLGTLVVYGTDIGGNPDFNVEVRASITTTADFFATPVLTVTGVEVGENLVFDFGGATLAAGSYFLTAYVERPFLGGGQWYWLATRVVSPPDVIVHNPGGMLQHGTAPFGSKELFNVPFDLQFILNGDPVNVRQDAVPEPATLSFAAIGLASLVVARFRREHDEDNDSKLGLVLTGRRHTISPVSGGPGQCIGATHLHLERQPHWKWRFRTLVGAPVAGVGGRRGRPRAVDAGLGGRGRADRTGCGGPPTSRGLTDAELSITLDLNVVRCVAILEPSIR